MNIAVLSSRFPYPLERGDKLRLYHQIRILAQSHDIHLFSISTEVVSNDSSDELRQFCKSIKVIHLSSFDKVINILKACVTKLPFQSGQYYSPKILKNLEDFLIDKNIDLVYCQLVRMTPLALKLDLPVVVDFMDAFSIGMKKRASLSAFPSSLLYDLESNRLKAYESFVALNARAMTIISDQDRKSIDTKEKNITIVANGIDFNFFKPKEAVKVYDVCFVGNLGYIPNIEASKYLCEKIKPRYKELYGLDLKIILAGARPHHSLSKYIEEGVQLLGWTDDIRDAYLSSKILVAPLFGGTGQQNKILEAMALGIPCVTSTKVNNAIFAKEDVEIMLADEVDEFCHKIKVLLDEPNVYQLVKKNGRDFVKQKYSWKYHTDKLNHIFAEIIKDR